MGVRIGSSGTTTLITTTVVTTAETLLMTTGIVGLALDNAQVVLLWEVNFTLTAGTTFATVRLRKGSLVTGTSVINESPVNVAASTSILLSGNFADTPGLSAGVQYSLTLQLTAAAANTTINNGSLIAIVL